MSICKNARKGADKMRFIQTKDSDGQKFLIPQAYAIGHQFISRSNRKSGVVDTVIDILTTTNSKGDIVSIDYLCRHDFMGQKVTAKEKETTLKMGETIKEKLQ